MSDQDTQDTILIQEADFSVASLHQQLKNHNGLYGAIVTFTGMVRELIDEPIQHMYLEHYPGMTDKALWQIVKQAKSHWRLGKVVIYHRIGQLKVCDNIVFVGVSSSHRKDAFEAASFIMDALKHNAPLWKKEVSPSGETWVAQKHSDQQAMARWQHIINKPL